MSQFGDIRLVDWRECGHHPPFIRAGACVEKLEGPLPEYFLDHPSPHDEMTDRGLGQWVSVGILLGAESVARLAESVADFQSTA